MLFSVHLKHSSFRLPARIEHVNYDVVHAFSCQCMFSLSGISAVFVVMSVIYDKHQGTLTEGEG
jgi:hypothetical protein